MMTALKEDFSSPPEDTMESVARVGMNYPAYFATRHAAGQGSEGGAITETMLHCEGWHEP